MSSREIHQCECGECQGGNEVIGKQHEELNLLMSRLDEQQRRWVVALEAKKIGHGGTKKLSAITGLDINTIRRGREELEQGLVNRPTKRIRVAGGGRKGVEKK
ncbi:MAG: transposase [Phormidesmis sp. CAN_BIN44]|nr:transposase [Phormidesmis sp. CAN_BIN44]